MRDSAIEIEKETKQINYNCRNLPNRLKRLMEKRRRLKRSGLEKIEYAEISKLLRRELKEWLEERKVKRLVDALENGGKLKERPKVRKVITCLNDKQGNEIREKDKILGRVKEFYEELYEGQRSEEDEEEKEETMMIESSDEWEDILEDEVRKAVAEIKEGKAGGIDRVTVEMIKAGGETVTKYLTEPQRFIMSV